jgi:predicted ATPase
VSLSDIEVVEEILHTDTIILERGRSERDGNEFLIKTLIGPENETRLVREFTILKDLNIPGVGRAVEMISDERGLRIVLEHTTGVPILRYGTQFQQDLSLFLKAAICISTVITELHRRDIVLNNIIPDALLFEPEKHEICLIDLSFATVGVAKNQQLDLQDLSPSSLKYLSPEQTRRMSRPADYRSDVYSLGAVFYELLTGEPPFVSGNALELVHSHLAKNPVEPLKINPLIPEALSAIVMKLLAKSADNRYNSAAGLRADLQTCADEYKEHRHIATFPLGQNDVSDRFNIPNALYGREKEEASLLSAFESVCEGQSALMVVSGYSGIGKTSLIQELDRPIVQKNGYFISGKFDQVARGTPFSALIQAFRGFVRQLLTEREGSLASWRVKLSEALGANASVLAEVIPEIELVIGPQPPPPLLGSTETLNRIQLVFQNFVGAIANVEHPLVVFLDDLQWADPATLGLLPSLLTTPSISHFFLIGGYRDNEVTEGHPLMRSLDILNSEGVEFHRLDLGPLGLSHLTGFISDILHCDAPGAEALAKLVWEKTSGNPFFVIQFLTSLEQEGFISFDHDLRVWTYDIEKIHDAAMTDNVIDLMTRKLRMLSSEAQEALTLAACIGNPFDLRTLAAITEKPVGEITRNLQEAIIAGVVVTNRRDYGGDGTEDRVSNRSATGYSFLHDRVQQAAYSLISDERKQSVHMQVGRLLYASMATDQKDERMFDAANHLNIGTDLIADERERTNIARLNLDAGKKAKASAAFETARDYFKKGAGLLDEKYWTSDYELAFDLNLGFAECEYLCGNFDAVEELSEILRKWAVSNLDKARIFNLRIVQFENTARYSDALLVARNCLELFGVSFPDKSDEKLAALETEIDLIQILLSGRSIESLIDLPVMTDPETQTVMNILTDIWSVTYITGDEILARLISATLVRLSLEYGNTAESAYGYVTHAITVGPVRKDYAMAYEFGRLALAVNERFDDLRRRAKIHQQFHAHVNLWRKPLETCIPHAREACRSGLEAGDFLYAAYGAMTETWSAIWTAKNLGQFIGEYEPNLGLIEKLKVGTFADTHRLMLNWARALMDKTESHSSLSFGDFDEDLYQEKYRDNTFFTMFHATARMQVCYMLGQKNEALAASNVAGKIVHHLSGTIWTVLFDFWGGLILADSYADMNADEKESALAELDDSIERLTLLGENCLENFLCHSLLLKAESERIRGNEITAFDYYERALDSAKDSSIKLNQALASELYAGFLIDRGRQNIAAAFVSEAVRHYERWGADAKVKELQQKYAALADTRIFSRSLIVGDALDIDSVTKAAQAITGEIELEKLLGTLIRIAIENAGAERGSLILERDHGPFVYATGSIESIEIQLQAAVPLNETDNLPLNVINYVRRTLESVVIEDAKDDTKYFNDPYVLRTKPRSILCVPVVNHGILKGVLYLENNVMSGAFSPNREKVCQILASQAAISLENAGLYDEMKQEADQRRETEEILRSIVQGTAAVTGDNFFASLVRHLASALKARYAFITECREPVKKTARTLAFWMDDRLVENVSFDVADTPCLRVLQGETCFYEKDIQLLFPLDLPLVDMQAQGYMGIPCIDSSNQVIGHLAVLDDKPMVKTPQMMSLLGIFAARAGAELERLYAENDLRIALEEVERLKNRLQAENIYLQEEIRQQHNFEEIIGNSPALIRVLQQVEQVAPNDSTVLITGETGTGKELIARAVHNLSKRKDSPLVKVNCAAISAGLVESELFGHVKGAFTGAVDKRVGRFELANGGTIFLDEVGELPLETQVKLLRVLQEGEFEPVGSSKTCRVAVRAIAATNRDLELEVREGRFRSDLFYRLNVFPIHVPSLRERREDIPSLVMFFLERLSKKFGKTVTGVSREVMDQLAAYDWLGNIRELQNIIERAVVLSPQDSVTVGSDLMPFLDRAPAMALSSAAGSQAGWSRQAAPSPISSSNTLEDVERNHIINVLESAKWKIEGTQGAAHLLNLHPNTLRSRLKKLGIKRP